MNNMPTVVFTAPVLCSCEPGHRDHVHLPEDDCPVLQRWYNPPRYGLLDYAIAGVVWRNEAGMPAKAVFQVQHGCIVAEENQLDIPAGVFLCLADYVQRVREWLCAQRIILQEI